MVRFTSLLIVLVVACAPIPRVGAPARSGYTGIVEKAFRVVRRGADLPGMRLLGQLGGRLGALVRQNAETHQYIVRTPQGQVIAQTDEEFSVGECVEVIPQSARPGPAFRNGEAQVVHSADCSS